MTEIQQEKFKEILSHLVTCQNNMVFEENAEVCLKEFNDNYNKASEIFKEHFPERPDEDIDYILQNARVLYSQWMKIPTMQTYTGRREVWKHFF